MFDAPTKEELIEQIKVAFEGVTREGGVSWSEADAIDDYALPELRAAAKASDLDENWMEVAIDANWRIDDFDSNWSFLDDIGFRYYIPAAMMRHLVLDKDVLEPIRLTPPDCLDQWIFNDAQSQAIANYVRYNLELEQKVALMKVLDEANMNLDEYIASGETWIPEFYSVWQGPYDYWSQFLPKQSN